MVSSSSFLPISFSAAAPTTQAPLLPASPQMGGRSGESGEKVPSLLTAQVKVEGKPQSPAALGPCDSLFYGVHTWLSFWKGLDSLGARGGQDGGPLWLRTAFQGQGGSQRCDCCGQEASAPAGSRGIMSPLPDEVSPWPPDRT